MENQEGKCTITSEAEIDCILARIPTGKLDERDQRVVSDVLRHFKKYSLEVDDESRGTSHTPTDKPTIKERMDYAKIRMQRHDTDSTNGIHYWTGYFTALVEIYNGDMQDYERL